MDKLSGFEDKFGRPRSEWTKSQWREAAETLAGLAPIKNKVGRPPKGATSVQMNYQALAHQVRQEKEKDATNGVRSTTKSIVNRLMTESWQHNQDHVKEDYGDLYDSAKPAFKDMRQHRIANMLETTYTEVRKLLAKQKSGGK